MRALSSYLLLAVLLLQATLGTHASLSNLKVETTSNEILSLSPSFSTGQLTYSIVVDNDELAVAITPTVTSGGENTVDINEGALSVASGAESDDISLSPGLNTITITATLSAVPTTYTLTVRRRGMCLFCASFVVFSTVVFICLSLVCSISPNYPCRVPLFFCFWVSILYVVSFSHTPLPNTFPPLSIPQQRMRP